jgi:hypothetical protein
MKKKKREEKKTLNLGFAVVLQKNEKEKKGRKKNPKSWVCRCASKE